MRDPDEVVLSSTGTTFESKPAVVRVPFDGAGKQTKMPKLEMKQHRHPPGPSASVHTSNIRSGNEVPEPPTVWPFPGQMPFEAHSKPAHKYTRNLTTDFVKNTMQNSPNVFFHILVTAYRLISFQDTRWNLRMPEIRDLAASANYLQQETVLFFSGKSE